MIIKKGHETKNRLRLDINLSLLQVSFTVFALFISLNPAVFQKSPLVPIQLTMSIPLLMSSIFARSKVAATKRPAMWEQFGFISFLISYTFLLNVLGILLAAYIGSAVGLTFLIFNVLMAFLYSFFDVIEEPKKLPSRIVKDLFFLSLILFGGIFPALGVY